MTSCFRYPFRKVFFLFATLSILTGCASLSDLMKTGRKPATFIHTVKWAGESLSIIAKWRTGSLENWKALAQANPKIDPNRLQIGEEIRIPQDLLKNKKPMPEDFVASFAPKGETAPPPAPQKAPPQKPTYHLHTVRWPGESLSIIAKWYTGDIENWRALARVNPGLDPNRIHVGDKIRIPVPLLKAGEPMPRDFVASFEATPAEPRQPAEAPPEPPQEEEPELFGPKRFPKK
ncbi:MAG: LysM peptidoglycan-binding domain-containing protein [Proteobacteria bacterium]|nr:LysM peptidoglycan-binding domain-containing protein [Pseudomonadota bacterium]